MSEHLCRLCGAHYHGTHSCNGTGNWVWFDHNKILDITAERDEWKQDAERLASGANGYYDESINEWFCNYCSRHNRHEILIQHSPNCPITLHRQLVAKYGGEK